MLRVRPVVAPSVLSARAVRTSHADVLPAATAGVHGFPVPGSETGEGTSQNGDP